MKKAIFDIGSNTILCLGGEWNNSRLHVDCDLGEVAKLSEKVSETNLIQESSLLRAQSILRSFQKTLVQHQISEVRAFSTAIARRAQNRDRLQDLVRQELGVELHILSGDEEAKYSFLGSQLELPQDFFGMIDIGGASTELTLGSGERGPEAGVSFDVGAVTLTEKFQLSGKTSPQVLRDVDAYLEETILLPDSFKSLPQLVVAVAGTPTEIQRARWGVFDREQIESTPLTYEYLTQLQEELAQRDCDQRVGDLGFTAKRADVILAGTCLLVKAMDILKVRKLRVSTWGLRLGLLKYWPHM